MIHCLCVYKIRENAVVSLEYRAYRMDVRIHTNVRKVHTHPPGAPNTQPKMKCL